MKMFKKLLFVGLAFTALNVSAQTVDEIVAKNKLSLASNLFGAAANHTASAVRVAATTAKRGVADSVIAHNPKELFHMATRVINKTVYSQKVSTCNIHSFIPYLLSFPLIFLFLYFLTAFLPFPCSTFTSLHHYFYFHFHSSFLYLRAITYVLLLYLHQSF